MIELEYSLRNRLLQGKDKSLLKPLMKNIFFLPTLLSLLALSLIYFFLGWEATLLTSILAVLEVTLSFDNAVVNAKVLKRMNTLWQKRFLTWGILLAVFGTRVFLPILIVAVAASTSLWSVILLAFNDSVRYGELLSQSHYAISSFGGTFLLMVSLKYFFDQAKKVHWLVMIEKRLVSWGQIEAMEIALALVAVLSISFFMPHKQATILIFGILGIVLFIIIEGIAKVLESSVALAAKSGFSLFLYLNVLDTAFSLDGVIGAFALSTNLIVIGVGLGIGAYFVRTMTVFLVRAHTLDSLIYLEHGAHWAIMGLAFAMLASLIIVIPEILIGSIGLIFIMLSYWSSRQELLHTSR